MPAHEPEPVRALSDAQIEQFIEDGFVRVDRAFPRELADEAREIMWRDLPCDPDDPTTWTKPVIRLPGYGQEPFRKAVIRRRSTPRSIGSSARGVGVRVTDLAPSPCVFPIPTIPAMPVGMSI